MKKLKLGLIGANGRMGQEIAAFAQDSGDAVVAAEVSKPGDWKSLRPRDVDVLIDFSTPKACLQAAQWCAQHKVPLVSGTTGLSAKEQKVLHQTAQETPVLWSSNMSAGVALLQSLLAGLAQMPQADFQLEEMHHRHKRDRPSGTAISLQNALAQLVPQALPEPLSLRGGGIFGVHRVWAMAPEETILLEHTALNRRVFARGALQAARWLVNKKSGMYSMTDVLGIDSPRRRASRR